MHFLSLGINKTLSHELGLMLLEQGICLHTASSPEEVSIKALALPRIDMCIFNADPVVHSYRDYDYEHPMLSAARLKSIFQGLYIIALSARPSRDILMPLADLGSSALISASSVDSNIATNIFRRVLQLLPSMRSERRQHVRLDIKGNDELRFNFPVPSATPKSTVLVEGHAENISMGGALLRVSSKLHSRVLSKGKRIDNLQLSINRRLLLISARVVATREDFLGIQFVDRHENFRMVLSRFIYDRLEAQDSSLASCPLSKFT